MQIRAMYVKIAIFLTIGGLKMRMFILLEKVVRLISLFFEDFIIMVLIGIRVV